MKRYLLLAVVTVAAYIVSSLTACNGDPESNYSKAQEYISQGDLKNAKKYLEKAAKGGHAKAQEDLESLQNFLNLANESSKFNNNANSQSKINKNSNKQTNSTIPIEEQLNALRKEEVALNNRVNTIIAARYDSKHTFGDHIQAMNKAMSTVHSLFQKTLSATNEQSKSEIAVQIRQQIAIAEQNAKWIEDNAPLRQAVVSFETDYIKGPVSIFRNAELRLKKNKAGMEKFSAIIKEINNTGIQIDNILEATDFNEARNVCQKSIPNISKSYAEIGEIALDCTDIYVYNICQSVLAKLDQEQSKKLEQSLSERTSKLKQQIEQQIENKDWENAEKTMADLKYLKVDIKNYQQMISQGKENN